MLEQIHKQLITTQILLESIVEELVESNLIKKDSLDFRIQQKIDIFNKSIDELETTINEFDNEDESLMGINYFGPTGEA